MGVVRNLMVRVGADASSFVKGMKQASTAADQYKKASKGTASASKALQNPIKAATQAAAAYREKIEATNKANAAAKERVESVSKAFEKSKADMNALKEAAAGLNLKKTYADQRAGIEQELEAVNAQLGALSDGMKNAMGDLVVTSDGKFLSTEDAQAQFDQLCAKSDELAQKLQSLDGAAGILGESFNTSTISAALKDASTDVDKLSAESVAAKADLQRLGNASAELNKIKPASVGAAAGVKTVKDNLKAAASAVGKGAANGISSFFKKITSHAKSSNDGVKKLLTSIKRIGVVSLGLKVASGIFGRLKSIISSYISENEELSNTVDTLKDQLGQALAPAINLIIGLVQQLMPLITGISSAIGQVISAVCGGIATTASAASDAVADAEDEAGKLYGFDKINKEESDSSSDSSSSSAAAVESSTMFAGIAEKIADEINKIKSLFAAGDWSGIGATLAGYLNGAVAAIEGLNLKERISTAVKGLTEGINGFVGEVDWTGLGDFLIGGFNTALQALDEFVTGIDWYELVKSAVEFLSAAITGFDWEGLGKLISDSFLALLDAAIALITETDWGALIDDILSGLGELIETIDWGGILDKLGEALTDIIEQLPDFIGGALDGIYDLVGSLFNALGLDGIGEFFDGLGDEVQERWEWLGENVVTPIVEGVKDFFGIGEGRTNKFKEIGTELINGILSGIKEKVDKVISAFKEMGTKIKSTLSTIDLGAIFKKMFEGIKSWINKILSGVESMANGIISGINMLIKGWNTIADLAALVGIDISVSELSEVTLPRLAKGGIAVKPTAAEIGEAGAEAVLPLENNTGWAKDVAALINSASGDNSQPLTIQIYVAGKKVAEETISEINRITKTTGKCPIYV